jgi:hypothetical protein
MAPKKPPEPQEPVPDAPTPSGTSPAEGMMIRAQELAREFMPNNVLLWAGVAFSPDSQASLWVKVQCTRMLALVAGAFPEATPTPPLPHDGGSDGRAHA